MIIVSHLKALCVNLLSHLDIAAAWLMQVSMLTVIARYCTGASQAYGRKRITEDGGEEYGPMSTFDPNKVKWRTITRMLHVIREPGFLGFEHRGAEWVMNVFSSPYRRMNIKEIRKGY